jgi:hypothetical protein
MAAPMITIPTELRAYSGYLGGKTGSDNHARQDLTSLSYMTLIVLPSYLARFINKTYFAQAHKFILPTATIVLFASCMR